MPTGKSGKDRKELLLESILDELKGIHNLQRKEKRSGKKDKSFLISDLERVFQERIDMSLDSDRDFVKELLKEVLGDLQTS